MGTRPAPSSPPSPLPSSSQSSASSAVCTVRRIGLVTICRTLRSRGRRARSCAPSSAACFRPCSVRSGSGSAWLAAVGKGGVLRLAVSAGLVTLVTWGTREVFLLGWGGGGEKRGREVPTVDVVQGLGVADED